VSLPRREWHSSVIASSQLGSLSIARGEDGTDEYLLTEVCRLSRSHGGICMLEVLCVRCTGRGAGDGACASEGGSEGTEEGGGEGACEGSR
jgi:hypothetical protein